MSSAAERALMHVAGSADPWQIAPSTLAKFFRGLGDPNRLQILKLVQTEERSVGELAELLEAPQGRISNHLTCLRWCGFVTTRKEGRQIYYRVSDERMRAIIALAESALMETASRVETCGILEQADQPALDGADVSGQLTLRQKAG